MCPNLYAHVNTCTCLHVKDEGLNPDEPVSHSKSSQFLHIPMDELLMISEPVSLLVQGG